MLTLTRASGAKVAIDPKAIIAIEPIEAAGPGRCKVILVTGLEYYLAASFDTVVDITEAEICLEAGARAER